MCGLLEPPEIDPLAYLADEMAKALREEHRTDPLTGLRHRVNYSARITKNGVQASFWGEGDRAPRPFMVKHFGERRKAIVADCVQLKRDVIVYNAHHDGAEPIQLVLDFAADVEERLALEIPALV